MAENQLEEKLDKLVSLAESQVRMMESQNRAWEKCLVFLNEMNTILVQKWRAQDILLEQHPPVKGPAPTTVGGAIQPQPLNEFSGSVPYGTELEAERTPTAQSFPPSPNAPASRPVAPTQQHHAPSVSQEQIVTEKRSTTPPRQVTSKAEILEQVEKRDTP